MEEVRRRRVKEEKQRGERRHGEKSEKKEDENDEERREHSEMYVKEEGVQSASPIYVHLYNVHTNMPNMCTYFRNIWQH